MFEKIDSDKSGGLDSRELEELFNEFNVEVDSGMIEKLFGKGINFTLDNFKKLNHSKERLEKYYKVMKRLQRKLLIQAGIKRHYMPVTFDEMMVNLGYHAERKEIKHHIEDIDKELTFDIK